MPSYDKAKMMRLLEAKRAIHLTSNDFYHRLRELREHISGKRTFMRSNANMYESRDQVESMLELPLDKARALTREQVEKFQRPTYTGSGTQHHDAPTGISYGLWGEYLQLLERQQRLEAEKERVKAARSEQFACVDPLVKAVIQWGFNSPEHEL